MPAFWNNRFVRRGLLPSEQPQAQDRPAPTAPLGQALELDARTVWPTHRIRSFLSMRGVQQARTGR